MDKDKITAQYNSDIRKNEQKMNELLSQKRNLEEKRKKLLEWKRRDQAYYNQLRNEMYGDGVKQDAKMVENLLDSTQHACRRIEQGFEQEYEDIERRRKQLSAQKDDYQANYRRDMQNIDKQRDEK